MRAGRMRGILPDDILSRPKKGFGMPVGDWFRGRFRSMLLDTLHERRIRDAGIVNPAKSEATGGRPPLW